MRTTQAVREHGLHLRQRRGLSQRTPSAQECCALPLRDAGFSAAESWVGWPVRGLEPPGHRKPAPLAVLRFKASTFPLPCRG